MIKAIDSIIVNSLWDSQTDLTDFDWFVSDELHFDAQIIDIHSGYIILGYLRPKQHEFKF